MPVVGEAGVVDGIRAEDGGEARLQKVKEVAVIVSADVCAEDHAWVRVLAGRQLHHLEIGLVAEDVLWADPGAAQNLLVVLLVLVELPAEVRHISLHVFRLVNLRVVRDKVVVEALRRAVA